MSFFKLTDSELEHGFKSIRWHGYSTLVPTPVEWHVIANNWDDVRAELAKIDLYNYKPFEPLRVFAPKNQGNVRVLTLLHPQDMIIYTALVHMLKVVIEKARLSKSKRKVFSYRASKKDGVLYERADAYQEYCETLVKKASVSKNKYVATADISDFYPRIYHHRLENTLESLTQAGSRERQVVSVLFRNFLPGLNGNTSYGIPVGPLASRILGEATLIDVDDFLDSRKVNFARWVDDFCFFCKSPAEAQTLLYSFGKWLFDHNGLTLSTAKTKLYANSDFLKSIKHKTDRYIDQSASRIIQLFVKMNVAYEDEDEDWDEDFEDEFDDLADQKITNVFEDAIKNKGEINYELAEVLLMRFAKIRSLSKELKLSALDVIIRNLENLFPIMDSVSRFIQSIDVDDLPSLRALGNKLLRPAKGQNLEAYEFYLMWVLDIFASSSAWRMDDKISQIKSKANNHVIKRYCDLALAIGGKRSLALDAKAELESAPPLRVLSLLYLSKNWGDDERKHWRRGFEFASYVDRVVFKYAK